MALIRWEPLREVESLQREMNRMFDTLAPTTVDRRLYTPPAEMTETAEAVHLKLEVPGLEPQDLDIQVTADTISIRGERKSETKTEDKGVFQSEFRYGRFQRVISLPTRIQNQNVTAEYKDGVLRLTLPKVEEEKHKVVKVEVAT
jgi:HSP20 family protein